MTEKLIIFDTTLRDGEQSPGASMTQEEKVRIALQLEKLGVDVIEAGFAAASPGDFKAIEAVAKKIQKSTVCSLARAVKMILKGQDMRFKVPPQEEFIHLLLQVRFTWKIN